MVVWLLLALEPTRVGAFGRWLVGLGPWRHVAGGGSKGGRTFKLAGLEGPAHFLRAVDHSGHMGPAASLLALVKPLVGVELHGPVAW